MFIARAYRWALMKIYAYIDEKRRQRLIPLVRVSVLQRRGISEGDLLDVINRALRENPKYNLPPHKHWTEMTLEEMEKVFAQYGAYYSSPVNNGPNAATPPLGSGGVGVRRGGRGGRG